MNDNTEPSPEVLAEARTVIEEGEYLALRMVETCMNHAEHTVHLRSDLDRLRWLAADPSDVTTNEGAIVRQLLNTSARVVDLEDQVARFRLVVATICRAAGLDLAKILDDLDERAGIVATFGESEDFIPAALRVTR
jgi:pyruvate formate-lyase activating enzyme-like uncharacterized protein